VIRGDPSEGTRKKRGKTFHLSTDSFYVCARSIFFLHADICGGVKSLSVKEREREREREREMCMCVCTCMAKE